MRYILGVDFGGSASKATLIDENGDIICTASREYPMYYLQDGWCEQSAADCYAACAENIREILRRSRVKNSDIYAMAVDSATHMAVLLDRDDRVIRNVIHWSDRRSQRESDFLRENCLSLLREKCLNEPSPLWTLPQLMWLDRHERESLDRTSRILFMKDYIRHRLTGDSYTDSIEAMGSMLFDETAGRWSGELCALAGISPDILPEVVGPEHEAGRPTEAACMETGLSRETRVIVGSTDTVLEVLASGSIRAGQATVKLASAGRICPITDHGICDRMLVNYRHVVPGLWYPGTANKACATSYRWYRDLLCAGETERARALGVDAYSLMDEEAAAVPIGADGLCYHPYLQGESTPYMDNDLRASFVGVSSFHTKGHFSRAVMEGVCFSLRDSLRYLKELGVAPETASIIGGGARSPVWSQMTADVLNLPLSKAKNDDSSLGSAMLAGVASGVFASFGDAVTKCARRERVYLPIAENAEKYDGWFERYRAIHDALAPIYARKWDKA
ncbi:MAG: FGGY family carbohydrate kinase [Oscillospiraceae bacterium]|nr:FGGY family carbohydrate kinase [Oscillospiraceae bacterium]